MPLTTTILAELIDKRVACLTQLRDLGRRQLELAEEADMSPLFKVLATKGHLINTLQAIERGLTAFRDEDPETRHWPSPADRQRCAAQAAEGESLLREIMLQEKEAESRLVVRRDEAQQRLAGAHSAQHARRAYLGGTTSDGGLLDLSSQ